MRRLLLLIGVFSLAATAAASAQQTRDARPAAAPPPPAPAGTAVISGSVTSEDGTRPVRFAYLVLLGTATGAVKVTSTDSDGRFSFANLLPDRYTVGASKPPYIGTVVGSKRAGRPGTPIAVAAGQQIANVAIRMPMGAVIAGTITDEKGQPAGSTVVGLMQWRLQGGERVLVSAPGTGTIFTDERGRYRLHGLLPGEYLVTAVPQIPPGSARVVSAAEVDAALRGSVPAVSAPAAPTTRYSTVYFPGTSRVTDALPIVIATGEERTNVDFRADPVPLARIEGTVVGSEGQPAAGAQVVLSMATAGLISPISGARIGADGRFSLTGAPGTYRLVATGATPPQFGSVNVELAGSDVFGVQINMRPAMPVAGQLAFAGAGNLPTAAGRRIPFRPLAQAGNAFGGPVVSVTNATGGFTITNLSPGRYLIGGPLAFGPTADTMTWALQSVVVDGRDITDLTLDVTAEEPPKHIVLTYGVQFQELSGRLQSQSGAAVSDYTILVFPEDKAYWIQGTRRIVTTRPGTDGRFTLSGPGPTTLPPGRYLLAAVTDIGRDEQFDPAFLAQVAAASIPLALRPGEKKIQDVAIK